MMALGSPVFTTNASLLIISRQLITTLNGAFLAVAPSLWNTHTHTRGIHLAPFLPFLKTLHMGVGWGVRQASILTALPHDKYHVAHLC